MAEPAQTSIEHATQPHPLPPRARFFRGLGPGLITGAADDDPSGISTYATAGIAGADVAQLHADLVLLDNSLREVLRSLDLARRAMRLVRQNVGWALAYNLLAVPLAAAGFIGPWEAALAMGASSLTVLANALRPLDGQPTWKASTSSSPSPSPSYS